MNTNSNSQLIPSLIDDKSSLGLDDKSSAGLNDSNMNCINQELNENNKMQMEIILNQNKEQKSDNTQIFIMKSQANTIESLISENTKLKKKVGDIEAKVNYITKENNPINDFKRNMSNYSADQFGGNRRNSSPDKLTEPTVNLRRDPSRVSENMASTVNFVLKTNSFPSNKNINYTDQNKDNINHMYMTENKSPNRMRITSQENPLMYQKYKVPIPKYKSQAKLQFIDKDKNTQSEDLLCNYENNSNEKNQMDPYLKGQSNDIRNNIHPSFGSAKKDNMFNQIPEGIDQIQGFIPDMKLKLARIEKESGLNEIPEENNNTLTFIPDSKPKLEVAKLPKESQFKTNNKIQIINRNTENNKDNSLYVKSFQENYSQEDNNTSSQKNLQKVKNFTNFLFQFFFK